MEWTTATAQALAAKTCRGKYGWPEYNTGDGIALRPATRALEAVETFTGAMESIDECQGRHLGVIPEDLPVAETDRIEKKSEKVIARQKVAEKAVEAWQRAVAELEAEIFTKLNTPIGKAGRNP